MSILSGNNNVVLVNGCLNVPDLLVCLAAEGADFVTLGDTGFSLQLNCYPVPGSNAQGTPQTGDSSLTWFQYVIFVANNQITWEIQYWANSAHSYQEGPPKIIWPPGYTPNPPGTTPWLPVFPGTAINGTIVASTPSNRLPNGAILGIALTTDESGRVSGATFSYQDPNGTSHVSSTQPWPQYAGVAEPPQYALYSIYGFEVDLVGPGNSSFSTFTSGRGRLYGTLQPYAGDLAVQNASTPCNGLQPGTAESSNIVYGDITQSVAQWSFDQPVYAPTMKLQSGWTWCSKCQGLAYISNGSGVCPAGGEHIGKGSLPYELEFAAAGQHGWRWCHKCEGLYYSGFQSGVCPTGGPHEAINSFDYILGSGTPNGQNNWRWCNKCQGLHYAGFGVGVCPAGGGHNTANSNDYSLVNDHSMPTPPGWLSNRQQADWSWCDKCQGLHYSDLGAGSCPAGGGHDVTNSFNYGLDYVNYASEQDQWNWCSKCHGLYYAGRGPDVCPAGGSHAGNQSFDYIVRCNTDPSGGQDKWRWCRKCMGMFYQGGPSRGVCPAGGMHDSTGSYDYILYWPR